ncbi:MAG TPA: hypothetical protein VFP59_15880 [Candidatus Angelobacter sp.]|nr:hypothetical protein [Candidatus Angelobacter sp.]
MKKLAFAVLVMALTASMSLAKTKDHAAAHTAKAKTINGWISDAKCGAKFNADCAKKCADAGEKLVVLSEKDKKVYEVDNQDAIKAHAGHHVRVTATDNNGTLHVEKVQMLKDKAEKAKAGM